MPESVAVAGDGVLVTTTAVLRALIVHGQTKRLLQCEKVLIYVVQAVLLVLLEDAM